MRGTRQFFPPLLKSTMLRKRTVVTYLRVIDLVIVAPPLLLVLLDVNNNFNHPRKMLKNTSDRARRLSPIFLLNAMYIDAIELFLTPMIYLTI